MKEPDAIEELARYIDHAITNADTRFHRDPTLAELDGHLAARWCKSWSRGADIKVACSTTEFADLAKECSAGPCLYEELEESRVRLFIGRTVVEGQYEGDSLVSSVGPSDDGSTAAGRLKEWMKLPRFRADSAILARGFFAGRFEHGRLGSC